MRQLIIKKRAREKPGIQANSILKLQRQVRNLKTKLGDSPNLKGGEKAMFLRQHRALILEFCDTFGESETQRVFCLKFETLEGLIRGRETPFNPNNFTKTDKLLAQNEIILEGLKATNQRIGQLEADYAQFTEAVAQKLGNKLQLAIALGLQQVIELPASLEVSEKLDPLNVANLIGQWGK